MWHVYARFLSTIVHENLREKGSPYIFLCISGATYGDSEVEEFKELVERIENKWWANERNNREQ